MPRPRVLFVKLSSLGDVVHHFPAVTDLAAHRPDIRIAWAVEEAYADLVRLHPAVEEVIPVGLRALKSRPFSLGAWRRMGAARRTLRQGEWDFVIDTQGLAKSAWVARRARGVRFGLDRASARERGAARSYDVRIPVPRELHAVERNRRLVAEVFGYRLASDVAYGLDPAVPRPDFAPEAPYAVLLHAASKEDKRWPAERWIGLGQLLARHGFTSVLPGGSEAERASAARLAASIPGAVALPALSLREMAALIANAWLVAGVDTGLTHLAVALGRPTVGIYCATRPELTGLHGGRSVNAGGPGAAPSVDDIARLIGYGAE
jgi:heptosyltransferase-1